MTTRSKAPVIFSTLFIVLMILSALVLATTFIGTLVSAGDTRSGIPWLFEVRGDLEPPVFDFNLAGIVAVVLILPLVIAAVVTTILAVRGRSVAS